MTNIQECPVCAGVKAQREWVDNQDIIFVTCRECGRFHMYAPFISLETGGWKSVPEEKRREIANFLQATREKRKELNVEFPVLDFNWRRYTKEGQDLIRREEYRRKKSETAKGSAHS